jgi:hypothetical protein
MTVYRDMWNNLKNQYDLPGETWSPEIPRNILLTICTNNNLSCIDPLEAFITEANKQSLPGKRLYFHNDSHWTPAGNLFVGKLLTHYLLSRQSPSLP